MIVTQVPGSVPAIPVGGTKPGFGHGIVMKADPQTELLDFQKAKALDYVRSVQITRSWAQLNPAPGVYDWTSIETSISARGKKTLVIILVTSGSGMVPTWFWNNLSASQFFTDPSNGQKYPNFWEPTYETTIDALIAAFGKRFNANRGIEFIRVGGYQTGANEPNLYGAVTDRITAQLQAQGLIFPANSRKPQLDGADPYSQAVNRRLTAWAQAMPSTRLGMTFHFPGEDGTSVGFDQMMVDFASSHRMVVGNTGLNSSDKTESRTKLLAYKAAGAQLGWFGLTNVGGAASWDTMLVEAVGDEQHPPIIPLSYVVVNADDSPEHDAQLRAFQGKLS